MIIIKQLIIGKKFIHNQKRKNIKQDKNLNNNFRQQKV
jgi:hypothetical protein